MWRTVFHDVRKITNQSIWQWISNLLLLGQKCLLPVPLDSSNSVEKLCDSWVLSTSVCGTGSFSAHTATHSINGSAHETQSFSTELRKTQKSQRTLDTTHLTEPPHRAIIKIVSKRNLQGGVQFPTGGKARERPWLPIR